MLSLLFISPQIMSNIHDDDTVKYLKEHNRDFDIDRIKRCRQLADLDNAEGYEAEMENGEKLQALQIPGESCYRYSYGNYEKYFSGSHERGLFEHLKRLAQSQ